MTQRSMRYIYSKFFSIFALLSPSLVSAVEAFNSALVELSSILGNQGILKKAAWRGAKCTGTVDVVSLLLE
ncbi:hypothetical protein [Pseudomonas sp. EA_15y_Pfl2_R67]|uniref:hypothetical protein n=1 Tax=Pseudomonas sp. EA_15y_Pfl2_R67 TaxID=3088687 RepID=UPI0030DC2E6B